MAPLPFRTAAQTWAGFYGLNVLRNDLLNSKSALKDTGKLYYVP